uniref:Uncharacterized protein n=1 Tax=Chaetoceros debilis TaxID=122233 RepID=A0A7S3Q4P1_9STRA|mmetsp:Transcript_16293/g.23883  ORF Transcript_16293/g.23883 Transcript_16293/m.23883 type:complete len:401 (+) Transcript_16293:148-1350(+)
MSLLSSKKSSWLSSVAAAMSLLSLASLPLASGQSLVLEMDGFCVSSIRKFSGIRARLDENEYMSLVDYYGGEVTDTSRPIYKGIFNQFASSVCDHLFGVNNPQADGFECDGSTIPFFPGSRNVMESVYLFKLCESTLLEVDPPEWITKESESESPTASNDGNTGKAPTNAPTASPTEIPSGTPTASPTVTASTTPSATLSNSPTSSPTLLRSSSPSESPTITASPTVSSRPSSLPSSSPSDAPTISSQPSFTPSVSSAPSASPSDAPSNSPIIAGGVDGIQSQSRISKGAVAGISAASVVIALIALCWAGPMLWKRGRKNNDAGDEDVESKVLTKHLGVQFPLKLQQENEPVKDNDSTNNSFRVGPPSRSSSFASNVDISDSPVKLFFDQENQDVNTPLI